MGPIESAAVQAAFQSFVDRDVYIHLETTNGAYAGEGRLGEPKSMAVCVFLRNARVRFHRATMAGTGPYRAGLQTELGWLYAEGLTDWELDAKGRLLLAGHDDRGRLAVALELSIEPFPV